MNPKLLPVLEKLISRDVILQFFKPDNLPQSALAYIRHTYAMCRSLSWEEHDLIETLAPFADHIADSFREGNAPDDSVYHLFNDGSLWLKTNAYSSIWADATDFAVEILLPRMELSRMDAQLLRAIGMDEQVSEVRNDFYSSFAHILNRDCGIPYSDAREHWTAYARQLGDGAREEAELGGSESGRKEGIRFASEYTINA
jgi:hypothetical protein